MSAVYASQASADAANKEYQLGSEQLDFEKQLWAHNQPMLDQITQADITSQGQQNQFSKTMQDAYTGTFLPLSQKYAQQAQDWASPEQQRLNANAAQANVANQFNQQRNAAMTQLEGFGIDPSATRYAALDIGTRAQQGAAAAAAGTNAIQQTKLQGMGLEAGAVGMGQGNATGAIAASNAATGAGSGGAGATVGGMNAATTGMTAPTAWYNSGAQNMGVYSNAVGSFNLAQNQAAQIQAQEMQGIGSIFGGLMGMMEEGGEVPQGWGETPVQGIPTGQNVTPGGNVPPQSSPSGGRAPDDVHAMLTANEFVIPKDVALWEGQKNLVGIIDKARKQKQQFDQRQDVGGQPVRGVPTQPPAFVSRPQPAQGIPAGM